MRRPAATLDAVARSLSETNFKSGREALVSAERMSNLALFRQAQGINI
jgi:hypothetical protein